MKWYLKVLKNYFRFQGRARRKEYWMFTLFRIIVFFVLLILVLVANLSSLLFGLYLLTFLSPSLAVSVRRLHDTGRSGSWYLVNFIPLICPLILLGYMCQDSQVNDNQYGPNPKV
jgi:uncharacterized membrane protein YhaH (DUF805 family)